MASLYDFNQFKVESPETMPTSSHWAVLLFETRSYNDSGYSEAEGGGPTAHVHASYYAFSEESNWRVMVDFLVRDRSYSRPNGYSFVAFQASGKATVQLSVNIVGA